MEKGGFIINYNFKIDQALRFYFDGALRNGIPQSKEILEAKYVLDSLIECPLNVLIKYFSNNTETFLPSPSQIPQFSSLDDCFEAIVKFVRSGLTETDFKKIGFFLRKKPRKDGAETKYGENHIKCAELMGLCSINKKVVLNAFSYAFEYCDENKRKILKPKLCLGIPIIRNYYTHNQDTDNLYKNLSCLSESTIKRRKTNLYSIINLINNELQ